MINDKNIDFGRTTTFNAFYTNMTTSYQIKEPLTDSNALDVVFLGFRDLDGHHIEVPCTYVAAELIRLYPAGTTLTLYISPKTHYLDVFDSYELIPLCIGAVRAV